MVDFILRLLEKLLTSVVLGLILAFVSFSYLTGRFPPQRSDIFRAVGLVKGMIEGTPEFNQASKDMQATNGAPTLEQLVEYQRLGLKRSEGALELTKIMKRFPTGTPNAEVANKLNQISKNLNDASQGLNEVAEEIQKGSPSPQ